MVLGPAVLLGLAALASVASAPSAAETGRALARRFECHRCHDGTGLAEVPRSRHCVRCHADILEGRFAAPPATLARWRSHLVSLRAVPSLAGAVRLRRAWVSAFLLRPVALRPGLRARMPRLALSAAEADTLARWLVPREAPPAAPNTSIDTSLVETGRRLYAALRCAACHHFTGAPEDRDPAAPGPDAALPTAVVLAPDLAFARQRLQPGGLAEWLRDPGRADRETLMPRTPLDEAQARALAAFILAVPLLPRPPAIVPARLPTLARRVGFEEVSRRVLRRTCWHCHASPDYARGDGGPGMTGGFGFAPRGLDLSSALGVAAGSLDEHGRRRSAFGRLADGTPRLLAHLLARQVEEAGGEVPGVRGMPLGLPALAPDEVQLVESWIAQGRPE